MKRLWIVMVWMLCSLAPVWSAEPEKKVTVEEEEERSALAFDSAELAKPMLGISTPCWRGAPFGC